MRLHSALSFSVPSVPFPRVAASADERLGLELSADSPCGDVESVFRSNWEPMFRLALLLVGSPQIAEEIAQEALTRWYEKRAAVDEPGAYMRVTVVNLSRGYLRRQGVRRRRAHLFEVREEVGAEHEMLLDVLDRLPPRQRAAVILRYYERCTEAEIAEALRCRPGTVKSLLSRALATMRNEVTR